MFLTLHICGHAWPCMALVSVPASFSSSSGLPQTGFTGFTLKKAACFSNLNQFFALFIIFIVVKVVSVLGKRETTNTLKKKI